MISIIGRIDHIAVLFFCIFDDVNINTIDISPYQKDKRILIIDVTLHMYAKK